MQMVDDEGISELISLAQSGPDGGTLNSESILAELKPFIKHAQPKPVLAGLKVLEEMMRNCTRKFHVCIAGDEWMRRLGKLVLNSNEPVLKSTVLQLLADWQEAYKNDPELGAIPKKFEEWKEKGNRHPVVNASKFKPVGSSLQELEAQRHQTEAEEFEQDIEETDATENAASMEFQNIHVHKMAEDFEKPGDLPGTHNSFELMIMTNASEERMKAVPIGTYFRKTLPSFDTLCDILIQKRKRSDQNITKRDTEPGVYRITKIY